MIEDVFDGQPVRAGFDGAVFDIAKTYYPIGDVASFWGTSNGAAKRVISGAPENRGKEWLGTTIVIDDTGHPKELDIVYFPGLVYLGTEVDNPKGHRFIVHLCEVVIPRLIQGEPKSNVPAVITGGEANPFPAIRALVDAGEETRQLSLRGIELGTQAHERLDHIEDPDGWITAGEWIETNRIDPESLLTPLQLEAAGRINEPLTLAAARELGIRATAIAEKAGMANEVRERRVRAGRYWANMYPVWLLQKACREIRGY